ncbi:YebC/PmpR family DNA-binding transcriptional regulator [Anatilimnocola floriformis]|uniref:YebC/PmpR family DNA-binding transcriptional regulator n=1 Tax=Anatilimnocola floriformis TaxID=2948575 RepID=UPI0020C2F3E2|nr:YebC/PmpR family DNA-binding transcriptional regulator [Anatilimnocola floriformis]
MGRDFENRKHSIMKTAGQKSKVYSKYGKQLYVAAKNGVPDPDANPVLRALVEKAKRDQVPAHVIEKAIEKAKGVGGENFVTARYEGFGPGNSMVIVDCLTDNNNRTITDVRNAFTKTDSKMGGSVTMWFDHLAIFAFKGEEEPVLETLIAADVNVEEIENKDGNLTVFVPAAEFYKAKTAILAAFPDTKFEAQEISYLPQTSKTLEGDDLAMFEKFLSMLNDSDDVQDVYHNIDLPR